MVISIESVSVSPSSAEVESQFVGGFGPDQLDGTYGVGSAAFTAGAAVLCDGGGADAEVFDATATWRWRSTKVTTTRSTSASRFSGMVRRLVDTPLMGTHFCRCFHCH